MITIGVDAHKRTHTAIALDERGQVVGQWDGAKSAEGWPALRAWGEARRARAARQWGIEGAGHSGRGRAQALLASGETVYDINPRWTALARRRNRGGGKNDRQDALAVARSLWQEGAKLAPLAPEDTTVVLDLLVQDRSAALADLTRWRNMAHAQLLQLDPHYKDHLPALTTAAGIAALLTYQAPAGTEVVQTRGATVRHLAARMQVAWEQIQTLTEAIEARARAGFSPLTERTGVAALTAGTLAGMLGTAGHLHNEAQLAAYAGVAPVEASSADRVRHRLNRSGNRQLNAVLHRIALTQARCYPPAKAYLARRRQEGKTKREAVRALKRYILRAVWRLWQRCVPVQPVASVPQAA